MLAELREFVERETPSRDAASIEGFVLDYSRRLEEAGLSCRQFPGARGPQLLAELPGEDPSIVLVGHCDTVWPAGAVSERPPQVRDGRLYGPGVYDMKAGLCIVLAAVRFLQESGAGPRRRLQVFIAADEESGGDTAHPCMDEVLAPGSTVFVVEPPCPDGSVKVQRKGVGIYELKITGREAHAGVEPERGISAVDELARLSRRHDVIAVRVVDPLEEELPRTGLVRLAPIAGGRAQVLDASTESVRARWRDEATERRERIEELLAEARVDIFSIATVGDLGEPVQEFFRRRQSRWGGMTC